MSYSQVKTGKAFEFACLVSLPKTLKQQQIQIVHTRSLNIAEKAFRKLPHSVQKNMFRAANAAIRAILPLEPQLTTPMRNTPLFLSIQEDSQGQIGDVRDIIMVRRQNDWEIGISAKHNHTAVKHSRLSQTIDFGFQWLNIPCSQSYFDNINPYFTELARMRDAGINWKDINDKMDLFYVPVLKAFMNELLMLYNKYGNVVPARLLQYLLGRHDFYKVIAKNTNKLTKIQAFCINGELNRPAGSIQPQTKITELKLPKKIYSVEFKANSKTTIQIVCDQGWEISARIHSARTKVEPSLKFDINLTGIPPNLYTQHEAW